MDMEGRHSQMQNAASVEANRISTQNGASRLSNMPVEASHTSQLQPPNALPMEASRISQLPIDPSDALRSKNMMSTEPNWASKSPNMLPARTSQLLLVPAGPSDDDVQTIKEVLSVHHVPVVASLHWEKLHSMLHTLCDRIAIQAFRLEKAEEQGKTFLGFKEELEQLCRNCVKEMKEAKESEAEQQKKWSTMVEERLQTLQQGVDENNIGMKELSDSVAELQNLDSKVQNLDAQVQSFTPRLDALEEGSKNFDRLDTLEEAVKNVDTIQSSHTISLESLNQKVDDLQLDFEEQTEKLHTLEEQTEQLKLKLEQTTSTHASDLDALQQYCRNLRSDFEMKFLVEAPTAEEEELSAASKAKLEAAVAELQNRIQKKADTDDIERIAQSTQTVKDACEKMESNMVELQSQLKRLSAGSRRASRVSFTGALVPPESQIQMFVPETKLAALEDLSPKLLDELTKDLKDAIEKHNKELEKVQKDFGLFGRSILKLSGHQENQAGAFDPADKLVKIFEGFGDNSPKVSPVGTGPNVKTSIEAMSDPVPRKSTSNLNIKDPGQGGSMLDEIAHKASTDDVPVTVPITKDVLVGTVDQMDDDAVVQAIDEALKANKFEAKENSKTIARLCHELEKLTFKLQELDTVMPSLKDSLALKADKRDLQKLARFVKEQLERPENAIFTGKPLYGFKCMSCDHAVEKLSRVTGEHMPTNRMPPQILPMLSAERIFSLDRRGSNNGLGPSIPNAAPARKSWVAPANFGPEGPTAAQKGIPASPRERRPQRTTPLRKGSPKKPVT